MRLKPHNVYALPDGHELVARRGAYGECALHDPRKGVAAAPVYFVTQAGQLLSWNRKTTWTETDLRDTGRLSLPEFERIVML